MSLLPIHLLGSPVLREPSAPVPEVTDEVRRLVEDMFETMDGAEGVGLAANQIGMAVRVAVVRPERYLPAVAQQLDGELECRGLGREDDREIDFPRLPEVVARLGHVPQGIAVLVRRKLRVVSPHRHSRFSLLSP